MSGPEAGDTLVAAALKVLLQPDPWIKAQYTTTAVELWKNGGISKVTDGPQESQQVPDRPHRADDKVKLVAPGAMPKLGKGGTLASRQALLHSLVHIENWAIDLSWDIIARFGADPAYDLPREFFDDFVQVAADECCHFCSLCRRLEALGSAYGALPAHDGLWESASATSHSLPARLAVEHCVHEARGLDVLPNTVHKFRSNGDAETAALLEDVIYAEEISHCAAGVRWLKYLHSHACSQQQPAVAEAAGEAATEEAAAGEVAAGAIGQQQAEQQSTEQQSAVQPAADGHDRCSQPLAVKQEAAADLVPDEAAAAAAAAGDWAADARQHATVEAWFHSLIKRHFKGNLKPPFNETARSKAGFGPEWYMPMVAGAMKPGKPEQP